MSILSNQLSVIDIISNFSELNNKPFRVPLRRKTVMRYTNRIISLVCFFLRIKQGKVEGYKADLLPDDIDICITKLISCLEARRATVFNVHELLCSVLKERRQLSSTSLSPLVFFLVCSNVTQYGGIENPDHIASVLTDIKWPFRASAFQAIKLALEDAEKESNNLNEIRTLE